MTVTEYRPKAYHLRSDGEDIDVDASNDGDYFVCPVHSEEIIYVMDTRFWQLEEGPTTGFKGGWCSLTLKGWCWRCSKHHNIPVGSYGG
jgi:hypothetical protein